MRAVFGILMMVLVLAVVMLVAKKQTQQSLPAPAPAASGAAAASAVPPQALPQAVGAQVEGLLQQGAARASEANP